MAELAMNEHLSIVALPMSDTRTAVQWVSLALLSNVQ
jgi:hypothetical protein